MSDKPLICTTCDLPVPPSKGGKKVHNKRYCSPDCRKWQSNQNIHSRRNLGYKLLRYMEKTAPAVLQGMLQSMEGQSFDGRQRDGAATAFALSDQAGAMDLLG